MIEKIKEFNWFRIILPLTTYHKMKRGYIHPMLLLVDLIILTIPFSTVLVILLVKYVLKDIKDNIQS